ncbi:MAG TPA: GAF and ANTAR domain-containing protein [Pseudonocardiaceae bacterium]|jgi:transcriptional regulator with GAF, ATPase, and Fis domain|nr:GAF and ANTAR domain-containing protein [Pseudonocardiaceae bacterium]
MSTTDRDVRSVFVELADTLVADFDVIDFLDTLSRRVVELLDVSACGVLLADHHGALNLVAASTEQARLLELFQIQNSEGPCLDCHRTGWPVQSPDLTHAEGRWPNFAPAARRFGFAAVQALPMRLREETIGALNLFSANTGILSPDAVELGQALANAATIGILHERAVRRHELVIDQLQSALNSRVLIEQAKGVLAERLGFSVDEAFTALRAHARATNRKLAEVARAVIDDGLIITAPPAP